jgi:ubiquinone/menaquinone biosynthesis C-methylase UbiE
MSSQQHQSATKVLDRRTLQRDHRVLAELLRPGMAVLDVGCGTGAITRGIAEAVGAAGSVTGVDRDRGLIERARATHAGVTNLRFVEGDLTAVDFDGQFDVVTAARTLQWVADPPAAVRAMARAARPGGHVVVLDYNHALNEWEPSPPAAFDEFYRRFLRWRQEHGWDNHMADRCASLLAAAGLAEIRVYDQNEVVVRGSERFTDAASIWIDVIDRLGPAMIDDGSCDTALFHAARTDYGKWYPTELRRHTLSLKTSVARVPSL